MASPIGLISSVSVEGKSILRNLSNIRESDHCGITSYKGTIYDKSLVYIISGIGKTNASRGPTLLIEQFSPRVIVHLGVGGAYSSSLPWRVEMAIQRLAKDLKVLPMFQGESDEAIKRMKLQIIQDILRPLKHPEFLKDLIVNCYVIARHVKNIQEEDIEKVIIEAFPMETLLPTSRYIFQELNRLREIGGKDPVNPSIQRRFAGVKRILKWVSRRLVLADVHGAQRFLEELYANGVLAFDELPADVQYLVNTQKMARDVAGTDLGQDRRDGGRSDAGNGVHKVLLALEFGVVINVSINLLLDFLDLLIEIGDVLPDGGLDGYGCCPEAIQLLATHGY